MSQCSECVLTGISNLVNHLNSENQSLILSLLEHHLSLHTEDCDCAINEILKEDVNEK